MVMVGPSLIITGVISLGKILMEFKSAVQKLPKNRSDIYALATELINESDELLGLRRIHASARVHELDRFLESLIKRLRAICTELDTLIREQSRAPMERLYNTGKNLYNADSVKDKIIRLRERVANAQQNFLVKNSLSMALNLETLIKGPVLDMQKNIRYLVRKAQDSPKNANTMFGVDHMSRKRSKLELRKATLDLEATKRERRRSKASIDVQDAPDNILLYVIQTKIRTLQQVLDSGAPLCNGSILGNMQDDRPRHDDPFYDILEDPCEAWRQPDALQKTVELLDILQNPLSLTTTPAVILWKRADDLSLALRALGLRKEAVQLSSIGHDLIRNFPQPASDSALYRSCLAHSLEALSVCRSEMGNLDGALVAIQEAVRIRRGMVKNNLGACRSELAGSLSSMSGFLRDIGRKAEALAAVQEAVWILRGLVKTKPGISKHCLADSLCNLSTCLRLVGRKEEALVAIQETVKIYEGLVKSNPSTFRSDFARSLRNLSNCLRVVGRKEEALVAMQETVDIYRGLVKTNPRAFQSDLAGSLSNLSGCLSDVGRTDEALTAIREAVWIRRGLLKTNPGAFQSDFACSLCNLAIYLRDTGRREEAVAAIQEAVWIRRGLVKSNASAFNSGLAIALHVLSLCLGVVGRREEALAAIQEAVEIYRPLYGQYPKAFLINFVRALDCLGSRLQAVGRLEEARSSANEASRIRQQ